MRNVLIITLLATLSSMAVTAQDFPTTKPLKIEAKNLDIRPSNQGSALRIPSSLDQSLFSTKKNDNNIQMLPTRELVQAGHNLKIDPKLGEREKKGSDKHFGDQYLGDIKSNAKFIGVVARDHEYVDGDRVRILVNGQVVEPNILLSAAFKGVNVNLVKGFNRIDFEALNQGSSGPNTAQVVVTDDKGQIIHNNRWNLSTGSVASLIVVKEGGDEEQ